MDQSPNLKLAYIQAAQAQKHVTHNEAVRALDALVQLAVIDKDLTAAPGSPANGDRYIVAASATGDWASQDGKIAAFQDGAWAFYSPVEGWTAWVADDDALLVWDGSAWTAAGTGGGSTNPVPLVGVNATADTTNRLSVSSPATLLNHEGDSHHLKINKNDAADTCTVLYQTGFSGRAETGLAGDDDYHFKVSGNGSDWTEALVIDKDNGEVRFPAAKIGIGAAAPGTAIDVDATGEAIDGLRIRLDANQNSFQFLKPDGSNLFRGLWDGGFFHHYLDGSIFYNLGDNFLIFSSTGSGRVIVALLAVDGEAASLTSQGLRIGESTYATAGTPNTTPQIAIKSWAWNGSNGYSLGTDFEIRLSQLSAANDDARLGLRRASDSTELFSLLVGSGNVGVGQTNPTAKLHVNGAVRVASYTVAGVPSASGLGAGAIIFVSDETGGAVLAFSDGTNWRRVTDRAVVS